MKKCQTVKDIPIENNINEREIYFTNEEQHTIFLNKNLLIHCLHPNLNINNKKIITNKKYQKRKNITNILTNDNYTISSISLTNSNHNINESNNSTNKIYRKKRIPFPQKGNITKENDIYYSIEDKKKNLKQNYKINNRTDIEKNHIIKDIKSEEKKVKFNTEDKNSTIPKKYNKNIKYISINNNSNYNITKKMKKYLYNNINNLKLRDKKKVMSDRHLEIQKKKDISNNSKKLDVLKINKIKSINNININLNNINNLNNKIDYNEIYKNINSSRNENKKLKDINFLKKLNFDQPGKYNSLVFKNMKENSSSDKTLLNNHFEYTDRLNHNNNYIYKNNYTYNTNNKRINTETNPNILDKKILYKIKPKIINSILLTPRNKPNTIIFKEEKKPIYINEFKSNEIEVKKKKDFQKDNQNNNIYSLPFQIKINNKNNNKKLDLFESSNQKKNNINKNDNINRINIFVNNGNNKNCNGNKNINININNNFDKNILTNDSITILNSSNSDIPSHLNSNDITQIESEKDEKNNVISSYQLNLYLNEAKKSNSKDLNNKYTKNIKNKAINKALIYISNTKKYLTEVNNNKNNNKTVDILEEKINLYQRNYSNKKSRDYSSRTYHPLLQKLQLKNILFSSINTNFKLILIKFLDKKSLVILSSLNKTFYKNFRKKIYKYFYERIIKNNGNKEFMLKILNTIPKYASKILRSNNSKTLKSKYEFYKKNKSNYNDIILQDIIRTFPNEPSFKVDSMNYKKLYNLLTSYSNYNKSIGYAQGLNFLAARSIFLFKNEEKVFIFLDGLINRFKLNHLLSINNQLLPKKLKYFSHILRKYCPEFINYLSAKFLNHEFFSTSWLLTLFSNSMDRNKLYICWCFMVIFGWKFFYSFVVQLLLFYNKNLLEIKETKLSGLMKEILKGKQFIKDFNEIVDNTLTFMSNNIVL